MGESGLVPGRCGEEPRGSRHWTGETGPRQAASPGERVDRESAGTPIGRIAVAAALASLSLGAGVLGGPPAIAAPASSPATSASFTGLWVSDLEKKITLPRTGTTHVDFIVNIVGTASDGGRSDINGDGLRINYHASTPDGDVGTVTSLASLLKPPSGPSLDPALVSPVGPGQNTYSLRIFEGMSPGKYEIYIPVTQYEYSSGAVATRTRETRATFELLARKATSRAKTRVNAPRWSGKTARISVYAPAYVKGAKATLYYKKRGTVKFRKIANARLKVAKHSSFAHGKIKTKRLTEPGKMYVKVSAVKWSKAYKTKARKLW